MTKLQLCKAMEIIKTKINELTPEQLDNYATGEGTLTILEDAIDEVLCNDEAKQTFWARYQSTSFEGTPCEAMRDFTILEDFYFATFTAFWNRNMRMPTIGQLKACTHGTQYCTINNGKTDLFKGWIDEVPDKFNHIEIDYLRIRESWDGFMELLIGICELFTEEDFEIDNVTED